MKLTFAPFTGTLTEKKEIDFSPVSQASAAKDPRSLLSFASYFSDLHRLILGVEVMAGGRILAAQEGVEKACDMILSTRARAGKVMAVGNGGSAAIASHMALDLWKACGVKAHAFNDAAQLTCLGNDFGYEHVFSKAIEMFASDGDVLVAISSSGKSQNILSAVAAAKQKNVTVIAYAGFDRNAPLLQIGDLNFYINSNQYGLVEVAHTALVHQLTDTIYEQSRK